MAEVEIGPPATHLLFENTDVKIWLMDVAAGDEFWFHHHDFDYILYYLTDVLATASKSSEGHAATWTARYDHTSDGDDDAAAVTERGIMTYAHSLFYIPGTGFLSPGFEVVGRTPMLAPLVEVLRPRRPDQEGVGFARTDALVGVAPRSGCVHLLENDRLRVYETCLAPGASDRVRAHDDAAVVVIDGGEVRVGDELQGPVPSLSGLWRPGAPRRQLTNVGSTTYRELSVELK